MLILFGINTKTVDKIMEETDDNPFRAEQDENLEYRRSHPWLAFSLNLGLFTPRLWSLLGECQSKCEHLAGVPLRPSTAKSRTQVYLAKGALASAAIEGNTLTEDEALAHVEGRLKSPPSREYLQREIDNLIRLHNEVARDVLDGQPRQFTAELIKEYNRKVLAGLEVEAHVVPGEIPGVDIGVGRYKGAPRHECDHLLSKLAWWLNQDWAHPDALDPIMAAIVKAVLAHLYLVWIHPFGDGNGRTARMLEVHILLQSGVPHPSCQLLSNHYNLTRERYYRELRRTSESKDGVIPFISYAVFCLKKKKKEQIYAVRHQQWDVSWHNYIHEFFKEQKDGKVMKRRRTLVLDLSSRPDPVLKSNITRFSPKVAEQYAVVDEKTASRDVDWLEKQGLIRKEGSEYTANRELILAFLLRTVRHTSPQTPRGE